MCNYILNTQKISNCKNIGLDTSADSYQYPILKQMVVLNKSVECVVLSTERKSEDINSMNAQFAPEVIVVADKQLDTDRIYYCNDYIFTCGYVVSEWDNNYTVWIRK